MCRPAFRNPSLALGLALAAALSPAALAAAQADRLTLLDGSVVADTVTGIGPDGRIACKSGRKGLDLEGLRSIVRPRKPDAAKPAPCQVHLADGGSLRARDVAADGQRFTIRWAYGGALALPFAAVRALRLGALPDKADPAQAERFQAAIRDPKLARDELFAIAEGKLHVVRGGLLRIAPEGVWFQWHNAERKVARRKVYGVVLATPIARRDLAGLCLVSLADGSAFWARVAKLQAGKLHLAIADGPEAAVPWDAVCRLRVRSPRMTFLSDLDPIDVVEEPIVTYGGPWQRDRNVVGGPLVLGDATFEKGLGVHARCRLTYALEGRYSVFAATVGIDASAGGCGDCVFRVEADGKELFARRVRGTDPPVPIRVPVAGARRLTLAVEWGENLDLGDRANWCDARLLTQEAAR